MEEKNDLPHLYPATLQPFSAGSVQFHLDRAFYNKIVLHRGRNLEPEPPGKHSGKEKHPFNRKKPGVGPGLLEETILLKTG